MIFPAADEFAAGSPNASGEPVFLAVGKLRRPHGVRGELSMEILTDFPERIRPGMTLYVGEDRRPLRLRLRRQADPDLLVAFDGYSSPEAAAELRNLIVCIQAENCPPLPDGEYYHHQLLHKQVVADDGRALGILTEILETGANDVAVIRPPSGAEMLLPLIDSVLLGVDEARGEVRVHLLPGILPED